MKNYKVIKEFASAQKGDMLTYNEDTNLYEFSMTTENDSEKCSRYICMDEETAEEFVESGNLLVIEDEMKSFLQLINCVHYLIQQIHQKLNIRKTMMLQQKPIIIKRFLLALRLKQIQYISI